jgi:hypothetical protein
MPFISLSSSAIRGLGLALLAAVLWTVGTPSNAAAQNLIKREGAHPSYSTELEPHLGFDLPDGVGLGMRATFNVADHGFISRLNDSVGVGVGADFGLQGKSRLIIPLAMQWNFWFTPRWSAFGEPGLALRFEKKTRPDVNVAVGGRMMFNDDLGLTLRVGWPVSSLGVSFLL